MSNQNIGCMIIFLIIVYRMSKNCFMFYIIPLKLYEKKIPQISYDFIMILAPKKDNSSSLYNSRDFFMFALNDRYVDTCKSDSSTEGMICTCYIKIPLIAFQFWQWF